jgi:type IV secretion system protein VirD4
MLTHNKEFHTLSLLIQYLKRHKKIAIRIGIAYGIYSYFAGIIGEQINSIGQEYYNVSWNVGQALQTCFGDAAGLSTFILPILIVVGICILRDKFNAKFSNRDARNFSISNKGIYGTSKWMDTEEFDSCLKIETTDDTKNTILGCKNEKEVIVLPQNSYLNKNITVFGSAGSMKTRTFVKNQILQVARRRESLIISDTKGELFCDFAAYLNSLGYEVRLFNLCDLKYSDSWNCLEEVVKDPDNIEVNTQIFCNTIIENTTGGPNSGNYFWDNAEMNLLKAIVLYAASGLGEFRDKSKRTLGNVYKFVIENDKNTLAAKFDDIGMNSCRMPWAIYNQAPDTQKQNIILGLGSRLQIFQSELVRNITSKNTIDLSLPGKKPCAYFIKISDQHETMKFLSSLFFSFLFIDLVRYADSEYSEKCKVPVNMVLDEFSNIGIIPDFEKKISTVRSRDIRLAIIIQNLAQLENRYPNKKYLEIIGNCDTQLFLACTDPETARFISDRSGVVTVCVSSQGVQPKNIVGIRNTSRALHETQSHGKRTLLNADEVLTKPASDEYIILNGHHFLKVKKFDYTHHPDSRFIMQKTIKDYIPIRIRKKYNLNFAFKSDYKELNINWDDIFNNSDTDEDGLGTEEDEIIDISQLQEQGEDNDIEENATEVHPIAIKHKNL